MQALHSTGIDLIVMLETHYLAWRPIWSSLQVDLYVLCQGPARLHLRIGVLLAFRPVVLVQKARAFS